tara:strand:+ start:694 stop:1233 length:540 start_codon:yes stop_codon:yes gene_type:complete
MKTYRELKKQIFESGEHTFGGGFGDRSDPYVRATSAIKDYGKGTFDLHLEDNINRVNAFLGAYFNREFVDPTIEMGSLKTKLNMIGLDIDCSSNTNSPGPASRLNRLQEGPNIYKITRFGGTFGKSTDTPHDQFEETDGFPDGMSYNLNLNVELRENGLYKINGNIMKQAATDDGVETA